MPSIFYERDELSDHTISSVLIMDSSSELWYAILASVVFNECEKKSLEGCPGCKAKLINPILHEHIQSSLLLDKMRTNFNEMRGQILTSICSLYDSVSEKLSHSPDMAKDKQRHRLSCVNKSRCTLLGTLLR